MSAILAAILAKALPWVGMAVSILAAWFGMRSSAKHAATAQANADVSTQAAKVAVKAQIEARTHVEEVAKQTTKVTQAVSALPDASVINELRENWSRDGKTATGSSD